MAQETDSVHWADAGMRLAFPMSVSICQLSPTASFLSTALTSQVSADYVANLSLVKPTFNSCIYLIPEALPGYGFALVKFTEFQHLQVDSKS